jgi:putative acetyltransferase
MGKNVSQSRVSIERADPRAPTSIALIQELDEHLGKLYPAESNHLMDLEALAAPEVEFFTAQVDGAVVGCGAIKRFADYAEVKRVFVSPRARGLGLARQIIKSLESAARSAGIDTLRLETGIYQPEALALFESAGFVRRGSFGDYPADDPYSVFMERRVS